jgi:hypothetical protein
MFNKKYLILIYMTEFFSNSKPDLISMKSMNDLVDIVYEGGALENVETALTNITKPASFDIKTVYTNYIKPNLLPIVIILLFISCIIFRYFSVKDEQFNPAQPIDTQVNHNNYVSGVEVNIPVLYDIEEINKLSDDELLKKMKKKSKQFEKSPKVNNCDGNPGEEREETIYGSNSWSNQADGYPNPMFGNDYITTTSSAVDFNNDRNKSTLDSAARMIFN